MGSSPRDSDAEMEAMEEFTDPADSPRGPLLDTTAKDVAAGKDIQGIPWDRLNFTREEYRSNRLKEFRNYTNVLNNEGQEYADYLASLELECKAPKKQSVFFEFLRNSHNVVSSITHFQLRNLLWATSKHDVFLMADNCVNHWDLLSIKSPGYEPTQVMNLRGGIVSSRASRLGLVNISTIWAGNGLVVAGGFNGQIAVQRLCDSGLAYEGYITQSDNSITNAIEVFHEGGEGTEPKVLSSNNDSSVRVLNMETWDVEAHFPFEWAVNYATMCPQDKKLVGVVGDDPEGYIMDRTSGARVAKLTGHRDYSFAAAWMPNSMVLATGNQDLTTRLWDMRKPEEPMLVLRGKMGAIRSVRFSSDGRYLAMAEPADFVHVFDVTKGYQECQEIDLFGEISGISFTPDADMLFVGIVDETYGSMVQYRRKAAIDAAW
ncbi:unnamed protein product [Ostreobium quekettii]|uniref:Uncharacterized protein n=1 Tax=Ostreobium quekettii TaxID=121088 RepID=A0A8S1JB89_9CHLO|nr:unnamed protein product [Ostreobium quekettii]|eukprot:evm.model.scf_126.7 EVM.evm.TU.scf_126.7   scf_126:116087-117382(-)